MERYGTVAMNHIQLGACGGSSEGARRRSTDVECDNRVFTDLPRRTGEIEARKNPSARGTGVPASTLGNVSNAPTIASAQKAVRRCDRKRF